MNKYKLTIGIIVSDDYHSLYYSLYNLLLHQDIQDTQLIVINNGLRNQHNTLVEQEVKQHPFIKYIKLDEPSGNSLAKNTLFKEANGDFVLCLDARVMLCENVIKCVKDHINSHPDSKDLVSGPLVFKDCMNFSTHQTEVWSNGVLGVWTKAWKHPSQDITFIAKSRDGTPESKCQFVELNSGIELPPIITSIPYHQHRQALHGMKCGQPGLDMNNLFQVPMINTSVFLCRKDIWPGLPEGFSAFDTDAYYLARKVGGAGGKCTCLGGLKFIYKQHSPNYTIEPMFLNKMKDCILVHTELDLPMDEAKAHFIDKLGVSSRVWDIVVANPNIPVEQIPQIRGVGTHVKLNLAKLGIMPAKDCACNEHARLMNNMGVQACKENIYTITGWLRDAAVKNGWEKSIYDEINRQEKAEKHGIMDQIGLRIKAVTSGLACKIDRKNPYLSIAEESIRLAESEEKTFADYQRATAPK